MNTKHRKLAGVLATIAVMTLAAGPSEATHTVVGKKARGVASIQHGDWTVNLSSSSVSALGAAIVANLPPPQGGAPAPTPGPLSVTQSGPWSVNLVGGTASVEVTNQPDSPLQVQVVDQGERMALHVTETVDIGASEACEPNGVAKIGVVDIPAGVRAVIEQVTARVKGINGVDVLPNEFTATATELLGNPPVAPAGSTTGRLGGISAALETITFDPTKAAAASATHFLALVTEVPFVHSDKVRLYADNDPSAPPGKEEVQIVLENLSQHNICGAPVIADFSATGYLVACPAGQGTCPSP